MGPPVGARISDKKVFFRAVIFNILTKDINKMFNMALTIQS